MLSCKDAMPYLKAIRLRFHQCEKEFPVSIDRNTPCPRRVGYFFKGECVWNGFIVNYENYRFYYKRKEGDACLGGGYQESHNIEGVTVFRIPFNNLLMVYFNAHSYGEGTLVPLNECETDPQDGALVVYVAKGSHACYSTPGTKWRIFGLDNDKCSTMGESRIYKIFIPLEPNTYIDGKNIQNYVVSIPSVSFEPLNRFMYPLLPKPSPPRQNFLTSALSSTHYLDI